jgi:hypothetical protein
MDQVTLNSLEHLIKQVHMVEELALNMLELKVNGQHNLILQLPKIYLWFKVLVKEVAEESVEDF